MQKSEGRLIAGRYDGREGLGSDLSPALLTSLRSCKTISGAYKVGVWVVFFIFSPLLYYILNQCTYLMSAIDLW